MTPKNQLYQWALEWDNSPLDEKSGYIPSSFRHLLDELLYHAELRYCDHSASSEDGEFDVRLEKWLGNLPEPEQRQALLRMVAYIHFVSRDERDSLYREALRGVIVPWIVEEQRKTGDDLLDPSWPSVLRELLANHAWFHITESCAVGEFLKENQIVAPRPLQLRPAPEAALAQAEAEKKVGIIVMEDFVGTGTQAAGCLKKVAARLRPDQPCIFVPLVMLETGANKLGSIEGVRIEPVVVVPDQLCVRPNPTPGELPDWPTFRSIVETSAERVMERLDDLDEAPYGPFGYKDSGALVVPCYSTPNNTLPLIWHEAPSWYPLFRRIPHAGGK